jgi:hypothetical protein
MPKAIPIPITVSAHVAPKPSRRGLLAGGTAALLAGAAIATAARGAPVLATMPQTDDAELLALVRKFHLIDAQLVGYNDAPDVPDGVIDPLHDEWWETVHAIEETVAATHVGCVAKGSVLPAILRDCGDDRAPDCRFALSLISDLMGEA